MHHTNAINNIEVADEACVDSSSGGDATCEGFETGIIVSQYEFSLSNFGMDLFDAILGRTALSWC